jgi:hypothetical protein
VNKAAGIIRKTSKISVTLITPAIKDDLGLAKVPVSFKLERGGRVGRQYFLNGKMSRHPSVKMF